MSIPIPLTTLPDAVSDDLRHGAITNASSPHDSPADLAPATGRQSSVQHEPRNPGLRASPEGGYGWVVTACSFTLMFLCAGALYSWGIFQAEYVTRNISSSLVISTVGARQAFIQAIGCLPATRILDRIGQQKTAALGMAIAGISFVLSSFSTRNIGGLIFLQGIMFGAGGSLIYITAYTAPSHWFSRWRGLSTGIASCGGGVGGAVFAIATQRLLQAWGLEWTYRLIGCLMLVIGVPVGLCLRPGPIKDTVASGELASFKPFLRSSRFIRILLACFIASYPFFIPPYFISQYAQSVGSTSAQGAIYSAVFNVASAIGRVTFGFLADAATGYITAWFTSIMVIALSSLLVWPHAVQQPVLMVFVILCGTGSGGFFALQSSVVSQTIGIHRLERGISWLEIAASFGFLAGPISAGALLDAFGGTSMGAEPYRPIIYLTGGMTTLAGLLVLSVRFSSSRQIWKRI